MSKYPWAHVHGHFLSSGRYPFGGRWGVVENSRIKAGSWRECRKAVRIGLVQMLVARGVKKFKQRFGVMKNEVDDQFKTKTRPRSMRTFAHDGHFRRQVWLDRSRDRAEYFRLQKEKARIGMPNGRNPAGRRGFGRNAALCGCQNLFCSRGYCLSYPHSRLPPKNRVLHLS